MPMQEVSWDSKLITSKQAEIICGRLEGIFRLAINGIRPKMKDYGVFLEGAPFGPITINQKDLRIWVFYHAEWNFTAAEKVMIWNTFAENLRSVLTHEADLEGLDFELRFYERTGHFSRPK